MCGICGIINFDNRNVEASKIVSMVQAMKHRGPDDEGIYIDSNIGLGFVRLSILDLSPAGNQPMICSDNRYVIVFNGEIFNYLELREELKNKYNFKTETDTEVILAAYREWGKDCTHKFNGMWAFAIYNTIEKSLFISRDRFGIKPFFYYQDKQKFIFASDIPPIIEVLDQKSKADDQSIYDFLVFNRTNYSERTFFKNIKKLQHSHNLIIIGNEIKLDRWYDLKQQIKPAFENNEEFRKSLIHSIEQQLRSDVPVGACLSGGIDSSSIVSLILKYFKMPGLATFSAVYEKGMRGDESTFIEEYKNLVEKLNYTYPTAESLHNELNTFVKAMVEPVPGTSEYAEFKVMELAKKHCTVLLNGQGADEEMAGYLIFFGYYFIELFKKFKWIELIKEMRAYLKVHHLLIGFKSFLFFLLPAFLKNKLSIVNNDFISSEFLKTHKASPELTNALYNSKTLQESFINHFEYKFEHHLLWADRSGMWFSIETRFPFLDHSFVERVLSLKPEKIIKKGITKHILRESMTGILPETIRMRMDKVGYETPEDDWFRTEIFQKIIWEILNSESFKNRGYFDIFRVKKAYTKHLNGSINIGKEIWKWIHLELWFRKFID